VYLCCLGCALGCWAAPAAAARATPSGGSSGGRAGAERVLGVALAAAAGAAQQPKAQPKQHKYTIQRSDSSNLTIALPAAAFDPVRWIQQAWEGVYTPTSGLPAAKAMAAHHGFVAQLPLGHGASSAAPLGRLGHHNRHRRVRPAPAAAAVSRPAPRCPRAAAGGVQQGGRRTPVRLHHLPLEKDSVAAGPGSWRRRRSSLLLQARLPWRRSARSPLPPSLPCSC
jgi:hypothetical protein